MGGEGSFPFQVPYWVVSWFIIKRLRTNLRNIKIMWKWFEGHQNLLSVSDGDKTDFLALMKERYSFWINVYILRCQICLFNGTMKWSISKCFISNLPGKTKTPRCLPISMVCTFPTVINFEQWIWYHRTKRWRQRLMISSSKPVWVAFEYR